jgi:broad specificity phosphatase PhoE
MWELGQRLNAINPTGSYKVFCSAVNRAIESAMIIADILGIGFELIPALGEGNGRTQPAYIMFPILQALAERADTVICISHEGAIVEIPYHLETREDWKTDIPLRIPQGRGLILDFNNKTITIV